MSGTIVSFGPRMSEREHKLWSIGEIARLRAEVQTLTWERDALERQLNSALHLSTSCPDCMAAMCEHCTGTAEFENASES